MNLLATPLMSTEKVLFNSFVPQESVSALSISRSKQIKFNQGVPLDRKCYGMNILYGTRSLSKHIHNQETGAIIISSCYAVLQHAAADFQKLFFILSVTLEFCFRPVSQDTVSCWISTQLGNPLTFPNMDFERSHMIFFMPLVSYLYLFYQSQQS